MSELLTPFILKIGPGDTQLGTVLLKFFREKYYRLKYTTVTLTKVKQLKLRVREVVHTPRIYTR